LDLPLGKSLKVEERTCGGGGGGGKGTWSVEKKKQFFA